MQQVKSICSYTVIPTEGEKCSFAAEPGPTIEEAVTAYHTNPRSKGLHEDAESWLKSVTVLYHQQGH